MGKTSSRQFAWPLARNGNHHGGSKDLIFNKLIKLVSSEQFHHKPMVMYGEGVLKLALGSKWGSSLPLEQCASTSQKKSLAEKLVNCCQLKESTTVAVSCGYNTCFAVGACDGLCHLTKIMDLVETPFGFQPIAWTFVRHTVSRCLIFPALPEVARVTWSNRTNHRR